MRNRSNYGIVGPVQTRNSLSLGGLYSIPDQEALAAAGSWALVSDLYFYYTTLLLNGENPNTSYISDISTNNFSLTASSGVTSNRFIPFLGNGYYSVYSPGNGVNNISIPYNANFNFGTSSFTIETWCYVSDAGRTQDALKVGSLLTGGLLNSLTNLWEWSYQIVSGVITSLSFSVGGTAVLTSSGLSISINTWHHFVVVRNSGILILYVDGLSIGSTSYTSAINTNSSGSVAIGFDMFQGTFVNWTQGYFSNTRIVNGSAVYTTNFIPITAPLTAITNTVLLTCQNNNFSDNSANAFAVTVTGTPKVSTNQPFTVPSSTTVNTGYSVYFNGSTDYFTTPSSSVFTFGTGDFTVEAWVYINSLPSVLYYVLGGTYYTTSSDAYWFFGIDASGHPTVAGRFTTLIASTASVPLNTWTHIAISRASGTSKAFVNGVLSGTSSTVVNFSGVNTMTIGAAGDAGKMIGFISNLRVINGSAIYTATFTPSTTPLTAITNTSLLTCQGSSIVDASTNAFTLTTSGSPKVLNNTYPFNQTTTTVSSISTFGSGYFDGSTGYLSVPNNAAFYFGTGDFTIEWWWYLNSAFSATNGPGIGQKLSDTTGGWVIYRNATSNTTVLSIRLAGQSGASNADYVCTAAPIQGVWEHWAVVRSGTTLTWYKNGVASGVTTSVSTNITDTSTTAPMYVGFAQTWSYYIHNSYISNLRVLKGTAVYTSNFTLPIAPLTPVANTALLTLQNKQGANNNSFQDDSINNFAITRSGTPTQGTFSPFSPTGWSNYFNGSSAFFNLPSPNSVFALGTGSITIEAWIYVTKSGAYQGIFSTEPVGSTAVGAGLYITNADKLEFGIGNGVAGTTITSPSAIPFNTWVHVAATRAVTTGAMALYINGISVITGTSAANLTNQDAIVGLTYTNSAVNYFQGYISNVRISNTLRTITVPNATYVNDPNTVFLVSQSNRFVDNSTNALALNVSGPSVQAFSPFAPGVTYSPTTHGGSMYFNGSSDYLSSNVTPLGAGDWTVEFWMYPLSTSNQYIFSLGATPDWGDSLGCSMLYYSNPSTPYFSYSVGSGNSIYVASPITNQWVHIALVQKSTIAKLYINGVAQSTTFTNTTNLTGTKVQIGHGAGSSWNPFYGSISNFRVISGTAVYTSNFAPPTSPLTATANTSLLLLGTNGGVINQSSRNDLITVGSAQINASVKKYGSGSLSFNGTTDYLTIPSNILYTFGTGDFTVECWLYPTALGSALGSQQIILDLQGTNSFCFSVWNGNVHISQFGVSDLYDFASASVANNAWFHLAICRSGTNLYCFLNGVQIGSTKTDSTNFAGTGNGYVGSGGSGQYFAGYIDDLRITKGYARYTANFTPPTAQFLGS